MVLQRIFLSVFITVTLALLAFSQDSPDKQWKLLEPRGENFSVEMPANNFSTNNSLDGSQRRFYSATNGTFFAIFSDKLGKEGDCLRALEFVHLYQQNGTRAIFGSVEGERFTFEDSDGFKHQVLSFSTKERMYVFQAISQLDNSASVHRFFGSLNFNNVPTAERETSESSIKPALPDVSYPATTKKAAVVGNGSGFGSGNGNGAAGSSSGSVTSGPVIAATTSPLNILYKPRAAYTDLAGLYGIQGSVVLKVTLLASGEVGSISVITKLPFGLTQNAIQAARSIKFEPKKINGVPVSVTKTIEYNFYIY